MKIKELKEQINLGTYNVNDKIVAKRIVNIILDNT